MTMRQIHRHPWRWLAAAAIGILVATLTPTAAWAAWNGPKAPVTAIADTAGRVFVFRTDVSTGAMSFNSRTVGTPFTGWTNMDGVNGGKTIAATIDNYGRIALFVRGTDNYIYGKLQTSAGGTQFTGWGTVGSSAIFRTDPVAERNSDGRLEVIAGAASGSRYQMYHSSQTSVSGWFSSWSSITNTVELNPGTAPDLSMTMGQTGRLVATAGQWYSTQAAPSSSSWSSWLPVSPNQPMDHIMIRQDGSDMIAVGLDYNCSVNCNIYGVRFQASGVPYSGGFFIPGNGQGAAHSGQVALTSRPNFHDDLGYTLGTDYNIYLAELPYPCSSYCGSWGSLGKPGNSSNPFAPASARIGDDLEFVFTSDYYVSVDVWSYQYGQWSGWMTL